MREKEPAGPDKAQRREAAAHGASQPPPVAPPKGLLGLQQAIGNRATVALLRAAQPKLIVGAANDPAEQEADAAARTVLRRLDATPRLGQPTLEELEPDETVGRLVARRATPGQAIGLAGGEVDGDTEAAFDGARGRGRALDDGLRNKMEGAFGADFSRVQVHSGAESASLNKAMGARAFTVGSDIFLGEGTPDLSSRSGEHLLAHELAHTIQQGGSATAARTVQRFPATALSDPPIPQVDWAKDTQSVKRSGEGASGGVYFVKTKNPKDPVQSLVVKPNFGVNANDSAESASQLVLGDRVISSLFGIGAPQSRIVPKGSPEFSEILRIVSPEQDAPPTDPEARKYWHPLKEAAAFIVMGAVPNAMSLTSLAQKAMDDPEANERLNAALFSESLLFDLGKLSVADMLIGNDDRMVGGAMNLGNLMVSSTNGGHKLYAIDSRAVLGDLSLSDLANSGSTNLTGTSSAKTEFSEGRLSEKLDAFFRLVKAWFTRDRKGPSAPEGALDPGELLLIEYEARKPELLKAFSAGFNDGMATVAALVETKEGQSKMKGVTDEVQGQAGSNRVQHLTMKSHAQYLAKRGKGDSHETAGQDTATSAAIDLLTSFNPNDYRIPEDEFFWNAVRIPGGDAYSAALDDLDPYPTPEEMNIGVIRNRYENSPPYNEIKLSQLGEKISDAKSAIDALGTKGRGISKKPQPRNRVVAGRFVADTYLLGAGSVRATSYAKKLFDLARALERTSTARIDPAVAPKLAPAGRFIIEQRVQLQRHLGEYATNLAAASKAVRKLKKFGQRDGLASELGSLSAYVTKFQSRTLESNQVQNANLYLNLLKSAR